MRSAPQPLTYTMAETAQALRVSKRTIARMIASGKLQAICIGRLVRVPAASLRQLVDDTAPEADQND